VRLIVQKGFASTSMIQRRFKIGYTRAARMVDAMEQHGIVGPLDGAKPREVLITPDEADDLFVPAEVRAYRRQQQNEEPENEPDEYEEEEKS
jgi:hypothetical protein